MRRPTLARLLIALSVVTASCASGPSPSGRPRFDASLISREQILEGQFSNAFDAVKTLRGSWLKVQRPESFRYPSAIQVYLDGVRIGDVSALSTIQALPVQYIRFYGGQEATSKWGVDHGAGAIHISTQVMRRGAAGPPPA